MSYLANQIVHPIEQFNELLGILYLTVNVEIKVKRPLIVRKQSVY